MTTATHSKHDTTTERVLFLAFELSAKTWKLGCTTGQGQKPRERTVAARELARVLQKIAQAKQRCGLPATAPVVRCYEAGREGCWLHRFVPSHGIPNSVVDSSSMEVNRRKRRAKSDALDVRKLVNMLMRYWQGERDVWRVVNVPTVEAEDGRHLHRDLETLQQARASTTPRIKGVRRSQGIRLTSVNKLPDHLDALRLWDGAEIPNGLRRRLLRVYAHHPFLHQQIAELEAERRGMLHSSQEASIEQVRQLLHLRGIGINGSWVLVRAFFGWRAFQKRREVGGLAGLTPTPYHSGESAREQGMTKSGNRHVRGMTTELAWSWLRYQPESALSGWFRERCGGGGKRLRRIGLVAVARKLLMALWRFLKTGAFPEGAVLKEAGSVFWMLRQASALVLVEAARCFSGPFKEAVGEMGSPPTGLLAVVERRREHRGTDDCIRTERRSLETRSPNATGSRQTNRGHAT